ncbi:ras GTPase-activating-like protein [Reticulomyxa filosa]|uniref:Ras GTPase-activating-like protein n=1 Tax=Reticulomyxa filosa TaxID=46433 RepID=X6NW55_RETFI|nr:ras GTPase-activating-like protein [Reticulomyxa filosa]|eukprot:ETO30059.1 ras GTPase-activating-like protein [Reticulomyxa filosa]
MAEFVEAAVKVSIAVKIAEKVSLEVRISSCAPWISENTGVKIDPPNFQKQLRSGTVLCMLANAIQKDIIPKFEKPKIGEITDFIFPPMAEVDNIKLFIEACKKLGVPNDDLFEPKDLHANSNLERFVHTLEVLSTICASQHKHVKGSAGVMAAIVKAAENVKEKILS